MNCSANSIDRRSTSSCCLNVGVCSPVQIRLRAVLRWWSLSVDAIIQEIDNLTASSAPCAVGPTYVALQPERFGIGWSAPHRSYEGAALVESDLPKFINLQQKTRHLWRVPSTLAEREGFEPPIALRLWLISSQLHSTGLCHLSGPEVHFTAMNLRDEVRAKLNLDATSLLRQPSRSHLPAPQESPHHSPP